MDQAIIAFAKKEYSLMLGERTAEKIKMAIGSACPSPDEPHTEIRGRDLAKLLLARPALVRALWPGAIMCAAVVTVVLTAGTPLLARLVARAGPVYGSFATVAGMFALLYLVGQALVYAAEVAAVRHARLWPRALDPNSPTAADARALALLAREQERIPAARIQFRLVARGSPPVPGGSPPANAGPG